MSVPRPCSPADAMDPLANNPYLNKEKCLLCQRDRCEDDVSDSEGRFNLSALAFKLILVSFSVD